MNQLIFYYYIFFNFIAFVLMGWDKHLAQKRKGRISERTLLLLGVVGGFIGAYGGMRFFHHKTKHWYFKLTFLISFLVHSMIIWLLASKIGVIQGIKLL